MSSQHLLEPHGLEPLIPLKTALAENYLPMGESTYYDKVRRQQLPPPTKIGKHNFLTPTQINEIRAIYNSAIKGPIDD